MIYNILLYIVSSYFLSPINKRKVEKGIFSMYQFAVWFMVIFYFLSRIHCWHPAQGDSSAKPHNQTQHSQTGVSLWSWKWGPIFGEMVQRWQRILQLQAARTTTSKDFWPPGHFSRCMIKTERTDRIINFQCNNFFLQIHNSTDTVVVLNSVNLSSTGNYRCEVSAEAPSFQTVSEHGFMQVVGELTVH